MAMSNEELETDTRLGSDRELKLDRRLVMEDVVTAPDPKEVTSPTTWVHSSFNFNVWGAISTSLRPTSTGDDYLRAQSIVCQQILQALKLVARNLMLARHLKVSRRLGLVLFTLVLSVAFFLNTREATQPMAERMPSQRTRRYQRITGQTGHYYYANPR
jgi:hypothetical protein